MKKRWNKKYAEARRLRRNTPEGRAQKEAWFQTPKGRLCRMRASLRIKAAVPGEIVEARKLLAELVREVRKRELGEDG